MESPSKRSRQDRWAGELREPLTRFAVSLGLSQHDAQDAVQDSLIALVRELDKNPTTIRNPKAYAFTVLRNNANKRFRERARRKEVPLPEDHGRTESREPDSADRALLEALRTAHSRLPERDADLLRKYYFDRQTYEEIGDELGCTAQNVWKKIKKIVSKVLAAEVKRELLKSDPELAAKLYPSRCHE